MKYEAVIGLEAVSYTHLDVYKRQPPYIYAFHRYTRNSACLSITQDQQF